MWAPTQSDTLWAKYSRAPRMPARGEQAATLRSAYSPPSASQPVPVFTLARPSSEQLRPDSTSFLAGSAARLVGIARHRAAGLRTATGSCLSGQFHEVCRLAGQQSASHDDLSVWPRHAGFIPRRLRGSLGQRQGTEDSPGQLLFIPDLEEARSGAVLRWVYGQPILTVSDAEGFTRLGGGIELARSGGRVQFVINTDALSRSGLTPSSQMLRLAQRVIGGER